MLQEELSFAPVLRPVPVDAGHLDASSIVFPRALSRVSCSVVVLRRYAVSTLSTNVEKALSKKAKKPAVKKSKTQAKDEDTEEDDDD